MKHKLIVAALASTMVSVTWAKLDFNPKDLIPKINKINNLCMDENTIKTVNNATKEINELLKRKKDLTSEHERLSSEYDKLKNETNNGGLNSNIDYKNPPSMISTFGNTISKEINTINNSMGSYCMSIPNMVIEYFNIQYDEQFRNYYKYLYNNGYYKSDKALANKEFLNDKEIYIESAANGAKERFRLHTDQSFGYYKKDMAEDPEMIKKMTIPVKDQINMSDIKLPTDLQVKLDKCFELYTNYCKTHNLDQKSKLPEIWNSLGHYPYVLKNLYLKKFYGYLQNHPEFIPKPTLNENSVKSNKDTADKGFKTSCENLDKQMDDFIKKMKSLK